MKNWYKNMIMAAMANVFIYSVDVYLFHEFSVAQAVLLFILLWIVSNQLNQTQEVKKNGITKRRSTGLSTKAN